MTKPAYLQQTQGKNFLDDVLSHLGGAAPPSLSIKGNRFTLVDANGDEDPAGDLDKASGMMFFDCVVVDALEIESKIFYAKDFDPNAQGYAPPDCWSDNGIAPSRNASTPQSPTCAACPKAEWGSKVSRVSGKGVPACGKYQKLALYPLGDDMLFLLRVPPNSLSNLRDYLAKLKKGNEPVQNVVTRISFVKDQLGTLSFNALAYIDEPTYRAREGFYVAKAADALVGRGDVPREGVALPAPVAPRQIEAQPNPLQPAAPNTKIQSTASIGQPAGISSPSDTPKTRRRRTAAQAEPAAGQGGPALAPFRPDPPPAQPNGQSNFGIAAAQPADAELSKTLDSIFGTS